MPSGSWETARDRSSVRKESASTPKGIFMWWTGFGAWCKCLIGRAGFCTTSDSEGLVLENSSCRRDCKSTTTIASMSWIPSIAALRCFTTMRRPSGLTEELHEVDLRVGLRSGLRSGAGGPAGRRRCIGHAQSERGQRRVDLLSGKPGLHLLPRPAQWAGRSDSLVEPDTLQSNVYALQQHDLQRKGQYPAHSRSNQQFVSQLP